MIGTQYQIILLGDRGTCVNNMQVVTWQWNSWESKLQPFESALSLINTQLHTPNTTEIKKIN